MRPQHAHCTACHSEDPTHFGSLFNWSAMGLTDIGSNCCLDGVLQRLGTEFPAAILPQVQALEPPTAARLLALSIRVAR